MKKLGRGHDRDEREAESEFKNSPPDAFDRNGREQELLLPPSLCCLDAKAEGATLRDHRHKLDYIPADLKTTEGRMQPHDPVFEADMTNANHHGNMIKCQQVENSLHALDSARDDVEARSSRLDALCERFKQLRESTTALSPSREGDSAFSELQQHFDEARAKVEALSSISKDERAAHLQSTRHHLEQLKMLSIMERNTMESALRDLESRVKLLCQCLAHIKALCTQH